MTFYEGNPDQYEYNGEQSEVIMNGESNDQDNDEDDDGQGMGDLIRKRGDSKNQGRSYVITDNGNYERVIRKRKRKSGDQLKQLMREFERNSNWTKETLLEVSRKTGLSEAQVYKWGWD